MLIIRLFIDVLLSINRYLFLLLVDSSSNDPCIANESTDDHSEELPFQVQITYTDLDGAQALRLITKTKLVTKDRAVAERGKPLG